ncbi:hypothetical protein D3C84_839590 [compost metagenome]
MDQVERIVLRRHIGKAHIIEPQPRPLLQLEPRKLQLVVPQPRIRIQHNACLVKLDIAARYRFVEAQLDDRLPAACLVRSANVLVQCIQPISPLHNTARYYELAAVGSDFNPGDDAVRIFGPQETRQTARIIPQALQHLRLQDAAALKARILIPKHAIPSLLQLV